MSSGASRIRSGAEGTSHESARQTAALNVPRLHVLGPLTVYPASQDGWQLEPLAREAGQSPTEPCSGAAEAAHGFASQTAAVSVPRLHVLGPLTVQSPTHVA